MSDIVRCPCCGEPMKMSWVDETHYDMCWGEGIPDGHRKYRCKNCKITYDEKEGWQVKKDYTPTVTESQLIYLHGLYRNGYLKDSARFGPYIAAVLSKEFASVLIQEKQTAVNVAAKEREKQFNIDRVLSNYGFRLNYTYNGYSVQEHKGYDVLVKIDRSPLVVHLSDVLIRIKDICGCEPFDNRTIMLNLLNMVDDLQDYIDEEDY